MTKLAEASAQKPWPATDRRRTALPQPDFAYYVRAKAYPGPNYFFVGHSFNLDPLASDETHQVSRAQSIQSLFSENTQWVPVQTALADQDFSKSLSRCESDLLHRLPGSSLVGPAIDKHGQLIEQSFTLWRKELRRSAETNEESGK